jgi:hypothetical protein
VKLSVFNVLATLVAASAGLLVLLGYFVQLEPLQATRLWLLSLVSLLAAWAVLAGALNLVIVHIRRFTSQSPGGISSLFVLLGFALVLLANIFGPLVGWGSGAASLTNTWLLTTLIGTGGAALAGLIAFFLVYAGYRFTRRAAPAAAAQGMASRPLSAPPTPMMAAFLVAALLSMLALAPWPAGSFNPQIGGASLRDVLSAAVQLPAVAGARGLLLGIALGISATGLRLLMGLHRPYGN